MEEVYAATCEFDPCVSAQRAAPLHSVSVEIPHNCERGVTARSEHQCSQQDWGCSSEPGFREEF